MLQDMLQHLKDSSDNGGPEVELTVFPDDCSDWIKLIY